MPGTSGRKLHRQVSPLWPALARYDKPVCEALDSRIPKESFGSNSLRLRTDELERNAISLVKR